METPNEGEVYRGDFSGTLFEITRSDDAFSVRATTPENLRIEMKSLGDGEEYSIPVDGWSPENYEKIADSVEEMEENE